ncbi:hypothetical protein [Sporosarcina sp. FSL K6-3457]|uniref:hypothetical protein n=1 Tax=Sporosarcina sp. FSL K6-3457 TaxID=2978204 RepID=UPI0030F6616E
METKNLNELLNKLEEKKIFYKLDKIRAESIMVEVAVPGERWEIEFMDDGSIEIEKFISNGGVMYDEEELETLFRDFSD